MEFEERLTNLLKEFRTDLNDLLQEFEHKVTKKFPGTDVGYCALSMGDTYYVITDSGLLEERIYLHTDKDEQLMTEYKMFLTKDHASEYQSITNIIPLILYFKHCVEPDYCPNWHDGSGKWYVRYDEHSKEWRCSGDSCVNIPGTVYFSSREIAETCATWLNDVASDGPLKIDRSCN